MDLDHSSDYNYYNLRLLPTSSIQETSGRQAHVGILWIYKKTGFKENNFLKQFQYA